MPKKRVLRKVYEEKVQERERVVSEEDKREKLQALELSEHIRSKCLSSDDSVAWCLYLYKVEKVKPSTPFPSHLIDALIDALLRGFLSEKEVIEISEELGKRVISEVRLRQKPKEEVLIEMGSRLDKKEERPTPPEEIIKSFKEGGRAGIETLPLVKEELRRKDEITSKFKPTEISIEKGLTSVGIEEGKAEIKTDVTDLVKTPEVKQESPALLRRPPDIRSSTQILSSRR